MLVTNTLSRIFSFKDRGNTINLPDPEPSMQPQEVQNYYTNMYPILVTAGIKGPELNDDAVHYEFVCSIGTKG